MALALDGTTGISASGNITGGNVIASGSLIVGSFSPASLSTVGNVQGGNIRTAGLISATGTITGSVFSGAGTNLTGTAASLTVGAATVAGTVTTAAPPNITSVGTLSSVTVTANVTGGNILTAGLISATGNVTAGNFSTAGLVTATGNIQAGNIRTAGLITATGAITTAGDISITGNIVDGAALTILTSSNGNITLAPNGTGVVVVNTDIRNGQASGTGNIGASGATFNTIFAKATSAQYADLAEMYLADTPLHPGTVVEFGGSNEITISVINHSSRVAGIISTRPSHLMNATLTGEYACPVALTGRVPCTVIGRISKGDCLVSSDHPGAAQRLDPEKFVPGCIIGKALQDHNSDSIGTIEVAVGRF